MVAGPGGGRDPGGGVASEVDKWRPDGEIIAFLVMAPSENDRERTGPMSAQLLHVIAGIGRRHTAGGGTVPVTRRYDPYERARSPPLPFLFQRRLISHGVLSYAAVRHMLDRTCTALAAADGRGARRSGPPGVPVFPRDRGNVEVLLDTVTA